MAHHRCGGTDSLLARQCDCALLTMCKSPVLEERRVTREMLMEDLSGNGGDIDLLLAHLSDSSRQNITKVEYLVTALPPHTINRPCMVLWHLK